VVSCLTTSGSTDAEFKADFRISRNTFEKLLIRIGPTLEASCDTGRKKMKARKQLLAVLWLLATPDSYRYKYAFLATE
jgi:hypothetical protein